METGVKDPNWRRKVVTLQILALGMDPLDWFLEPKNIPFANGCLLVFDVLPWLQEDVSGVRDL